MELKTWLRRCPLVRSARFGPTRPTVSRRLARGIAIDRSTTEFSPTACRHRSLSRRSAKECLIGAGTVDQLRPGSEIPGTRGQLVVTPRASDPNLRPAKAHAHESPHRVFCRTCRKRFRSQPPAPMAEAVSRRGPRAPPVLRALRAYLPERHIAMPVGGIDGGNSRVVETSGRSADFGIGSRSTEAGDTPSRGCKAPISCTGVARLMASAAVAASTELRADLRKVASVSCVPRSPGSRLPPSDETAGTLPADNGEGRMTNSCAVTRRTALKIGATAAALPLVHIRTAGAAGNSPSASGMIGPVPGMTSCASRCRPGPTRTRWKCNRTSSPRSEQKHPHALGRGASQDRAPHANFPTWEVHNDADQLEPADDLISS